MRLPKYTKDVIQKAVDQSLSVAQVLRELGLKEAGGSHSNISRKIKEYGIDTSHFLGQRANCGPHHKGSKKKSAEDILVLRTDGRREAAYRLRRALIESGVEYACEICKNEGVWNGSTLRLEVDHKNNNWLDDRKENLRFLCPNCHSQQRHKYNQGLTELTSIAKYTKLVYAKKKKAEW